MTRAPRTRRPAGARREQILDVAAAAFAVGGYRGTSLAEVASRVGVSQPGLLHHFPTKDSLILAVLRHRDLDDDRHLETHFADATPTTRDWLTAMGRRNETQPDLVRLFTVTAAEALAPEHPAHEFFLERNRRVRASMGALVRRDQERGVLAADLDADQLAIELMALMNGLQLQWLRDPSVDMCGVLEARLDRLVAGER
ncbi:TetR/AcrR family transcriptional regulator [Pseudonocardia alni]|uniref:TetR/AcrR family transcriptional regulator n=1 Tax=Pseudonocardia alni TaxID=33907 RepID=UPI00332D2EE7